MVHTKAMLAASIVAVTVGVIPHKSFAEEKFTAAELLKWSEEGRRNYYQTSITMMAATLAQGESTYGKCVGGWFWLDPETNPRINPDALSELDAGMKRFPSFDPRGVMLAWVKKICGPFPKIIDR